VGFAGDGRLQVVGRGADRQAGGRIAGGFEVFQMAVGMAGLTLGGGAEHGGNVVVAFDVGLVREVQVAAVGLRLAGKRGLQVAFCLGSLELHGGNSSLLDWGWPSRGRLESRAWGAREPEPTLVFPWDKC
jgi:hypothetical protein